MKLNLSIEYRTSWGEELVLCLGGKRYPLSYVAEGIWKGEIARFNPAREEYQDRVAWAIHMGVMQYIRENTK